MLDIKGQQVNIGDKVLVSSKYHGLVLDTFIKETKSNYYFTKAERISKLDKKQYVGYDYIDKTTGKDWVAIYGPIKGYSGHNGVINYADRKRVGKGTNGSGYITKDMSTEKQSRVLKVANDFEI